MPVLFALTLFVSATLLFMVQPMVGRKILPLLGGSPAAWNTCMVFFQALLLGGYWYAHKITSKLAPRLQFTVHVGVVLAALAALGLAAVVSPDGSPIAVMKSLAPQGSSYPMFGVLALLGVAVGIPFFVVSTSAPLLQRWFAHTEHESAKDPYFLYAASNAGSLISLLGYPILVEPSLGLANQGWVWAGGFLVLFGLTFACGRAMTAGLSAPPGNGEPGTGSRRNQAMERKSKVPRLPDPPRPNPVAVDEVIPLSRKLKWMMLAFVPSSLMLGVTFHMTTDIASIPLLWVIPLALYLLTFIIAYSRLPGWFRPVLGNVSPVFTLLLVFVIVSNMSSEYLTPFISILLHLTTYFLTALLMHSELAHDRPTPAHLTNYFLWISVGGMLGGVFNGLIAPVVFPDSYEYRIAIVVGAMLVPKLGEVATAPTLRTRYFDVLVPIAMIALVSGLIWLNGKDDFYNVCNWISRQCTALIGLIGFEGRIATRTITQLVVYAIPAMLCFAFIDRPIRFGLCVGAILLVQVVRAERSNVVESKRSFFGILRVTETEGDSDLQKRIFFHPTGAKDPDEVAWHLVVEHYLSLVHGTTLHGTQATTTWTYDIYDDLPCLVHANPFGAAWGALATAGAVKAFDMRQEPLTYYHRTGPVGEAFEEAYRRCPGGPVAMVGLGTGSVACYAQPGQKFTFFEIDPTVVRIVDKPKAADPNRAAKQFTYLADARARGANLDIVLGDARLKLEDFTDRKFCLLLVDAFSSDSIPVHLLTKEAVELYRSRLADHGLLAIHISNKYVKLEPVVARIADELGMAGRVFSDSNSGYSGKTSSHWVVLARTEEDLGQLGAYETIAKLANPYPLTAAAGGAIYAHYNAHWKPLTLIPGVQLWTDQYADVLQVMMLKEVQSVRRFFGLSTPVKD